MEQRRNPHGRITRSRPYPGIVGRGLSFSGTGSILAGGHGESFAPEEAYMFQKLTMLAFAFALLLAFSMPAVAQEGSKQGETKAESGMTKGSTHDQEARWEGVITRSNKDKNMFVVRKIGGSVEKTIYYDNSTHFVSQEHGSKKVNEIDASQIKDGDRVIVKGTDTGPGKMQAKLVSKRLTPQ
jgi:hypothetical protein